MIYYSIIKVLYYMRYYYFTYSNPNLNISPFFITEKLLWTTPSIAFDSSQSVEKKCYFMLRQKIEREGKRDDFFFLY